MKKTTQKHVVNRRSILNNYRQLLKNATPKLIEQAALWYVDAQSVAQEVANNLSTTLEVGASIVAAFSPRERWTINVTKSIKFSLGQTVNGLKANYETAIAAKELGFKALRGPKTHAFAKAVSGDTSAIVVDVWMMRGAKITKDAPTKNQYKIIADCVQTLADELEMTPRTTQALIWILARGSAE